MAYTFNWTMDNTPLGKIPFSVPDLQTNITNTSLTLYGRGALRYGEGMQENFLRLMEHFASPTSPLNPTLGQIWFNTADSQLHVCTSISPVSWTSVGAGATTPDVPVDMLTYYEEFVATAGQTVFNTSANTITNGGGKTYLAVFVNGAYQQQGATKSYTVTGAHQVTFTVGLSVGSIVSVVAFDTLVAPLYQEMIATASQTVFNTTVETLADPSYRARMVVYVNGVCQQQGTGLDYTVTGAHQITFASGLVSGSDVVITSYGSAVTTIPAKQILTSVSGQSVFNTVEETSADVGSKLNLMVFVNGVYQRQGLTKDYTVTGTRQITFNTPIPVDGAAVTVISMKYVIESGGSGTTSAPNYEELVATAGQTIVNTSIPTIANGGGKTYLTVYVNGIYQQQGVTKKYVVSGTNRITFNTGLSLNDNIVLISYT